MSNILTGFNMQGNDPIDNRIVSPSKFETLEEYLQRVPIQKRYYGLSFYALDENNELRHYTFQTSLIEPTIDDDEEEIERLDKELQEHVNNKEIHKTSEEIRSEIVDADIPDTIARVQWTLDKIEEAVNTVMGDIVDGASDEYNTLKKIQDKIVELRTEVESQLYGDDGGEVLKTLEQALKFLNQYKDFIVDIPDNYVNKQDIVDNLNTDDPTKVLSARQGKVLSETLTNYFDSAMASIRAETNRATNAENRIEAKLDSEIDRSTAEDIRIQSELDAEEARAQSEEQRIEDKLDAEIERSTTKDTELGNQIIAETNRAKGEEQRIETKLDNEITRSTAKDADHDSRIEALEGETHIQNTDIGTTSQTFQLQMGKPGNKIKNEDAAVSVRNAADTDYVNFIAKNATFKGNLIVEGQSFVTEAETVEIKDNILLLNKGETGSGVTKGMAGLQIDRGTEPDFQILFVESDRRFKAGEEGNLQCLALRDDDGNMLDGMFTTWDSTTHRLKTTNIIPSTRKLFFNTNANSLGFAYHTYDSSYSAESFIFTDTRGSLYFSAGESSFNLYTDKTYFRFFKNLKIPSSIISSGTSISLLKASGATIATFGSSSTINSTLNVANQVIIKGGSDTKLKIQSADADNFNLIESQNSSGTKLSTFGYYGTFWGIDGYSIATESWSNNKFLPLAGGTMTGVILMNNNVIIQSKNSSGTAKRLIGKGSNNVTYIGDSDGHTFLYSDAADISHIRNGTSYRIWDAFNLTSPLLYASGTAATPTTVYNRNLGVNDSQWTFLSATNAATTSIYAPTAAGTSGQVLTSTGGVPTWSNISSVGDSRYVLKSGDTMTGSLRLNGGWLAFSNNDWTNEGGVYKEVEGSLKVWRVSTDAENKPSAYGSVLQINSRSGYWNTQLWIDQTNTAENNGKLRYRSTKTYSSVEWNNWTVLATEDYVNSKAAGYLPLTGGTLTGQVTIKQSVDVKLRLQSTDADNHCIIQAIDSQASQLGVFGYAGDKWAIGHNGTYYEIWDKYNLTNPVTYTTNTYNHATLTNKDGQYFTYIKAGTDGLLPHSKATLVSGGSGSLGTSDQSFNAGYINNLHTNKITFGETGPYIIGSTSATQFLDANGSVQKVATGGLYVGISYASDALSLVPANGIYSRGIIYIENGIGFRNSIWTNDLTPNKNYSGYLQVLDAYDANNAGGPTNYGTVLQVNSRNAHWANQLWFSGGAEASKNGLYYRHMAYNETTYGEWNRLLTNKDVNIIQTQSSSNPSTLPANQIFYSEIKEVAGTPTVNGSLFSVQGDDEGIQLWAGSNRTELYYRTKWTSFGNWIKLATTSDLGNYLPLTGGTLSGNLTINTIGSITLVINNNDTNGSETFMRVLRKGTASAAIGFRDSLGAYIYNYNSNKYLFIDNDGYARVGTTSGSTRLALITDIPTVSGYLPLSGGTLTGALTMSSRRNNVVVDVVGGAGQSWNEGAGALSIQIPNDNGQTPLLLARRSGATINTTTLSERLLDMALLDTGTIFRVGMSGVNALELEVTSFTNKVGIGKLFGKQIATTDQIPSIPSISISNSGSGNAVTSITASGHTLTVTKGATYLTSSSLSGYATQSWVTSQGYLTSSSLSGYATQTWANGRFLPLSGGKLTGDLSFQEASGIILRPSNNSYISGIFADTQGNECVAVWAKNTVTRLRWHAGIDMSDGTANLMMGITPDFEITKASGTAIGKIAGNEILHSNNYTSYTVTKTGGGASGTWGINVSGNASSATKLGSSTVGGTAKPIYLSSGTATACSATVGSSTVPVYMSAGTITQCSTTLGVSITGNAATATTATNSNNLGGYAAATYVKSTSTTKVQDIQVVTTAGSTTGVLYVVLES